MRLTIPDPAEQAPLVARSVTPPSPSGRGGTTLLRQRAPRSCTVFVMTPPNEHTSEGGRDDRGVPYHAESTLSSAQVLKYNARALSGAGKRTAASGVAWSGCASLRGPLCAGEALLEARTQASVALFKLGAHSATLRPEFGGPKSLRCCCAKGVGHRAQLMLRARRGARENDYPVPLLRTPTPQKLSLSCPHSGGSQLPSPSTSCHVADRERISSCSARRVAKAKVLPEPPGALTTWRRLPLHLYL